MNTALEAEGLRKTFPARSTRASDLLVLDGLTFSVAVGEFFVVVGPSGCGKTTLLNILGGFLLPDTGTVRMDGKEVKQPGPDRVVLFQNYALFEWRTAIQNIMLPLEARGIPSHQRRSIATEALDLVRLSGFEDSYPYQLSRGMQQRLALARALAVDPKCILLDEPFAALDRPLRLEMAVELLRVWHLTSKTVVMVTHDLDEAIYMGDRILVLSPRPARIEAMTYVDLPRPRRPEMRSSREFDHIKQRVYARLARSR